jgi:hypothetical protein
MTEMASSWPWAAKRHKDALQRPREYLPENTGKYVARFDDVRDNTVTSLKWRPSAEGKSKILVAVDAYKSLDIGVDSSLFTTFPP